jgi:FHA domain
MILCPACRTLNPDRERRCLACGNELPVGTSAPQAGPAATCSQGHPIDPSWESCPYCSRTAAGRTRLEGEGTAVGSSGGAPGSQTTRLEEDPVAPGGRSGADAGRRTRLEAGGTPGGPRAGAPVGAPPTDPAWSGTGRPTRLEETVAPAPRRTVLRETVPPPVPARPGALGAAPAVGGAGGAAVPPRRSAAGAQPAVETRPLVAVLAAPHLAPGGAIFPVRSGKTTIGGTVRSDVCLSQDPEVSGEHALLLHRGGRFFLADRLSTNGTWVNGSEVDGSGTAQLADRDRIRCGSTELILLILEPASEGRAQPAGARAEKPGSERSSTNPSQ